MQAALFGGFFFPPPATRARIFTGFGGARAWRAPNTGEALIVERMPRHGVFGDVLVQHGLRPVGDGVELDPVHRRAVGFHSFDAKIIRPGERHFAGADQLSGEAMAAAPERLLLDAPKHLHWLRVPRPVRVRAGRADT